MIEELEQREDGSLRVYFTGIWGCDVELSFEGEVSYCTKSRDPMEYDPYWGDSQIAIVKSLVVNRPRLLLTGSNNLLNSAMICYNLLF